MSATPAAGLSADLAVAALAASQRALITHSQVTALGWDEQRIQRRIKAGRIARLHHCVYAFAGAPDTWERSVHAAVLACGEDAAASHESAAALHGFAHVAPRGRARISVSVPPSREPRPVDVVLHRTILPADHVTIVEDIPVTTYERTLVDLTGRLSLGELARNLDTGLVAGSVRIDRLRSMLDCLGPAPGRRLRVLRTLLDERGPETEHTDSTREIRLLRVLRSAGVRLPQPQYEVTVSGREFRFDGAYPDVRVALEYLGWDPHRTRTAFDHDHERDRLLSIEGWTILYFTSASTDAEIVRDVQRLLDVSRNPASHAQAHR